MTDSFLDLVKVIIRRIEVFVLGEELVPKR